MRELGGRFNAFAAAKFGASAVPAFRSADTPTPQFVRWLYEQGYSGIMVDPQDRDQLSGWSKKTGGYESVEDAATANGWADAGAGQLSLAFIATMEIWPKCWPGDAQIEGSCVGHNGKNAGLITLANEIAQGKPDEVTGVIEGPPDVPQEGVESGVFSIAGIYPYRGSRGHGWSCYTCAKVMVTQGGLLVARKYDEFGGLDLTNVTRTTENLMPSSLPEGLRALAKQHQFRTAAEAQSREAIRDALAVGIGLQSCGSEGFSSTRNEHGVARRSGSWSHAMAIGGEDDRPWAHKTYGCALRLFHNSWSRWNSGPRDIYDSARYVPPHKKAEWIAKGIVNPVTGNIMIPEGSFWARESDVGNRDYHAMAGAMGWKRRKLDNWGGSLAG